MGKFIRSSYARLTALPGGSQLMHHLERLKQAKEGPGLNVPFRDLDQVNRLAKWILDLDYQSEVFEESESENRARINRYDRPGYSQFQDTVASYWTRKDHSKDLHGREVHSLMLSNVLEYFHLHNFPTGLKRLSIGEAFSRSTKGTNLGLPYLTSNWRTDILTPYLVRAEKLVQGDNVNLYPFTLFTRVQQGKGSPPISVNKVRAVWGADHAETFASLTYLYPILEAIRSLPGMSAWLGFDEVNERVATLAGLDPYGWWVSGDFSGFDQNIGPWYLNLAMDIIESLVPDIHLGRERLVEYYSTGELVTPEGILAGFHGLPSGVGLTNLVDTFVNMAVTITAFTDLGFSVADVIAEWHGDDFFMAVPKDYAADFLERIQFYGLDINVDKSHQAPNEINYLQRWWTPNLKGAYPLARILARLAYSERYLPKSIKVYDERGKAREVAFDRSIIMLTIYSKLENGKFNPYFREFVKKIMEIDRYELDPSIIGEKWSISRAILGYMSRPESIHSRGLAETATYQAVVHNSSVRSTNGDFTLRDT